jgi:hypothetical protein
MAVKYPTLSGNWSNSAIWNGGTLPTAADDVYSNNFTVTIDTNVTVLTISNRAQSPAIAGGGFILNGGITVTCTATIGILCIGAGNCITFSSSGTSTINATITDPDNNSGSGVLHSGSGTLNINGYIRNQGGSTNAPAVRYTGSGILNVVGNIETWWNANTRGLIISGTGTVNIVGNIQSGNQAIAVTIDGISCTVNITGIVRGGSGGNASVGVNVTSICTINHTGDVIAVVGRGYLLSAACSLTVTGNVYGGTVSGSLWAGIHSTSSAFVNIYGSLIANFWPALESSSNLAINICTGPFVSGVTGMMPFYVARMHYRIGVTKYIELRDSSTNGALPPAVAAPSTRFVSPDTVVDAPIAANVRNGVVYGLGTYTGTLKVPSPSNVTKDIETDNTVGTAALTPESVWGVLTSVLTASGSIGERLKNAATVETTGDQLASII